MINEKLAESSITLLENKNVIPIQGLDTLNIAALSIGKRNETVFQKTLSMYTKVTSLNISKNASDADFNRLYRKLEDFDLVITGVHSVGLFPGKNYNMPVEATDFLGELSASGKAVTAVFGSPYLLGSIENVQNSKGLIVAYQETGFTQRAAAEAIFGGIPVRGKLPVSIQNIYPVGSGIEISKAIRLNYTFPEDLGINTGSLYRIDSLAELAIRKKATPGCQVLVAKEGHVIFQKSYGFHTYDSIIPVKDNDLYDLASVTKVSGALPGIMKLYDEGKFDLEASIGDYIPYFKKGNKKKLTFREIFAHQVL